MNTTTQQRKATEKRDDARARFNAAKPYTKAWREAGEDLDFWSGKAAMLDALARRAS
jgi:hypothetical protein